jgi:hypothetical protein
MSIIRVGGSLARIGGSLGRGAAVSNRALLSSNDFTYLGTFQVPTSGITGDGLFATGLTHRYVGGQFRLLTRYHGGGVIEFTPATPKTTTTYNIASTVRDWGSVWSGKLPSGHTMYGLHWDETDQRLYWNCVDTYSTASSQPSFGYATLDEGSGTATPYGTWYVPSPPNYKPMKGMTAIPSFYHSALGGKRIALGFGGYESIVATGAGSLGPTLMAADLGTLPAEGGTISSTQLLMNHPYNATAYTQPMRAKRNPNYLQQYDDWDASGGVGYWTWGDEVKQSAVWIDTGTKQGFLVVVRQVMGGQTASIASRTLVSGYTYDVTFSSALGGVRVGDIIQVPLANPAYLYTYSWATVNTVTTESSIRLTMRTDAPDTAPELAASGTVYRQAAYYGSTLWSTEGRLAGFLYDSDTILTGGYDTDEVPYAEEFALPSVLPDRIGSWSNDGTGYASNAGICYGATFDSVTNKLYLLFKTTAVGTGNNGVVCVYQVS